MTNKTTNAVLAAILNRIATGELAKTEGQRMGFESFASGACTFEDIQAFSSDLENLGVFSVSAGDDYQPPVKKTGPQAGVTPDPIPMVSITPVSEDGTPGMSWRKSVGAMHQLACNVHVLADYLDSIGETVTLSPKVLARYSTQQLADEIDRRDNEAEKAKTA